MYRGDTGVGSDADVAVKVYVVYGAPASGKTTYVRNHIGTNDIVYDFDSLMQSLTGLPYQTTNHNVVKYVMDIRRLFIDKLHHDDRLDKAYIITTFIGKSFEDSLSGLDVQFVRMETSKGECIARLNQSDRPDKEELYEIVQDWFDKYGEHGKHLPLKQRKKIYNSKAWKDKRQEILRRDNYECVWCKEQGKVTVRDRDVLEIDHILEIERAPELVFEDSNLRTLCRGCHSKRHKRNKENRFPKNKWSNDEWW